MTALDLGNPAAVWDDVGWRTRFQLMRETATKAGGFTPAQTESIRFFVTEVERLRPPSLTQAQKEIRAAMRFLIALF